jgi:hypothetical protein
VEATLNSGPNANFLAVSAISVKSEYNSAVAIYTKEKLKDCIIKVGVMRVILHIQGYRNFKL